MKPFDWFHKTSGQPLVDKNNSDVSTKSNVNELANSLSLKAPSRKDPLLVAAVADSMALMRSIPTEHHKELEKVLLNSIASGGEGLSDLMPHLAKIKGIEQSIANLIALDLTRKVYCNLSKYQMLKLGIKKFKWLHTGGGNNPFEEHIAMSGSIYSFENPPIINSKTGQRGFPSDLPGCRCRMIAVIEF